MTRREQYETYIRACLANPVSSPCQGHSISTDAQIIAWLEGLGVARSAWETGWLRRLRGR